MEHSYSLQHVTIYVLDYVKLHRCSICFLFCADEPVLLSTDVHALEMI